MLNLYIVKPVLKCTNNVLSEVISNISTQGLGKVLFFTLLICLLAYL